jgi:hypothetical protein
MKRCLVIGSLFVMVKGRFVLAAANRLSGYGYPPLQARKRLATRGCAFRGTCAGYLISVLVRGRGQARRSGQERELEQSAGQRRTKADERPIQPRAAADQSWHAM